LPPSRRIRPAPIDSATPSLPWREDNPTPLVLLRFSSVEVQRSPTMLRRGLDALAVPPVRVVVTTGDIVDPAELSAPWPMP
jgi:hypothetical protein